MFLSMFLQEFAVSMLVFTADILVRATNSWKRFEEVERNFCCKICERQDQKILSNWGPWKEGLGRSACMKQRGKT